MEFPVCVFCLILSSLCYDGVRAYCGDGQVWCQMNASLTEVPGYIPSGSTTVFLDHNRITTLRRNAFDNLPYLEGLLLRNNLISTIEPGAFRGLERLDILNLNKNQLTEIRDDMWIGVPGLTALGLDNNKIASIPDRAFRRLKRLRSLGLEHNELTEIRRNTWQGLRSLEGLWLTDNKIARLPWGAFKRIPKLKLLFMHDNDLTEIRPNMWIGADVLEHVELSSNRISELAPGAFSSLKKLTDIFLFDNQLTTLHQDAFPPEWFNNERTELHRIELKNNPLECDGELCWMKEAERRDIIYYGEGYAPTCGNFPNTDWSDVDLECEEK